MVATVVQAARSWESGGYPGLAEEDTNKRSILQDLKAQVIEVAPPSTSKELKKRWSYFIRKVYETDPLICPNCKGELRIISFIDKRDLIRKILEHLDLWEEAHAPPDRDFLLWTFSNRSGRNSIAL